MRICLVVILQIIVCRPLFCQSVFADSRYFNAPENQILPKRISQDNKILFVYSTNLNNYEPKNMYQTFDKSKSNKISKITQDSSYQEDSTKSESFFKSSLFYFIGTAVAVLTLYFILHSRDRPTNSSTTFGLPPTP
jgi:hypothetical protein